MDTSQLSAPVAGGSATARDRLVDLAHLGPLPRPGSGRTWPRFEALAAASRPSLSVGRLYEAHTDGQAILADAGYADADSFGLLAVWASDRTGEVTLEGRGVGRRLVGTKPFCSGAALVDHALVTARSAEGVELCLVALDQIGVVVEPSRWVGAGMRDADTRTVRFDAAACTTVGATGWYLDRPGFWHGGAGVAASWFGGAEAIVATMLARVDPRDPHQQAALGDAETLRFGMEAALRRAAEEIDRDPDDAARARVRALRVRRVVADGCLDLLAVAAGALGPRSLAFDAEHAQRVADLDLYVRQDHGRRDAEELGRSLLEAAGRW